MGAQLLCNSQAKGILRPEEPQRKASADLSQATQALPSEADTGKITKSSQPKSRAREMRVGTEEGSVPLALCIPT